MAGRALQIVGDSVMKLITQVVADHMRDHRCDTTQLGVAKSVTSTGLCQKLAVCELGALR